MRSAAFIAAMPSTGAGGIATVPPTHQRSSLRKAAKLKLDLERAVQAPHDKVAALAKNVSNSRDWRTR